MRCNLIQLEMTGRKEKEDETNRQLITIECKHQAYIITKKDELISYEMCGCKISGFQRLSDLVTHLQRTSNTLRQL